MENYGKELILDIHGASRARMNRKCIKEFTTYLCEQIDMEACKLTFWDDRWEFPWNRQTNPKTTGISAVRFIITSNITIHALTKMGRVYINLFSCKDFDSSRAAAIARRWFGGNVVNQVDVCRI